MANKTATIVTRTLDMGFEDFNRDLTRAVRGHVIGSWTEEPRFMVATGEGSAVIECHEICAPDTGRRLAVSIEFRRCAARHSTYSGRSAWRSPAVLVCSCSPTASQALPALSGTVSPSGPMTKAGRVVRCT